MNSRRSGEFEYSFRHALTQEVAYNSLLVEHRRAIHERTARSIEEMYPDGLEDAIQQSGASLFPRQQSRSKAIDYSHLAAEQALGRGAYNEATGLIETALKLLDKIPEMTSGYARSSSSEASKA